VAFRRLAHFQPVELRGLDEMIEFGQDVTEPVCAFGLSASMLRRGQQQWKSGCRGFQAFADVAVFARLAAQPREGAQCCRKANLSIFFFC